MNQWRMLTLVGKDKPGIVAAVTTALTAANCNIGETSMLRLGGNFTIMMMVEANNIKETLHEILEPVAQQLDLAIHVDSIEGDTHQHIDPNITIGIYGADRTGIISQATSILAELDFNILNLSSDVAGTMDSPIYVLSIAGQTDTSIESIESALSRLQNEGMDVHVEAVNLLIG